MKCPRCFTELRQEHLTSIPLATCATCHGTWYEGVGLAKLLRLKQSGDLMAFSRDWFEQEKSELLCPRCETNMLARTFVRGEQFTIDQCGSCHGVWFDPGELLKSKEAIRRYFLQKGIKKPVVKAKRTIRAHPVPKRGARLPYRLPKLPPLDLQAEQLPPLQQSQLERDEQAEAAELEAGTEAASITIPLWLFALFTGLPVEAYNPPRRLFPWVVVGLITSNCLIFAAILAFAGAPEATLLSYGASPDALLHGQWLTLITYAFIHAGWIHLLANMYFLWTFGDNVEDRLGHWQFLIFYLGCGIGAICCQIFMFSQSGDVATPVVGASGAIAGIMGCYMFLFPKAAVYQIILFYPFKLPIYIYLGLWVLLQIAGQAFEVSGVAWGAHLGGFICGYIGGATWYYLFRRAPKQAEVI